MPDHIVLKLPRYLENLTYNMISSHRNILFSREECLNRLLRTSTNFSKSVMVSVEASTLGRSHLVFINLDFIPPTHSTNVARYSLHHGLVYGRLTLAQRSTLYDQQDSNLDCPEATMWEEWSLVCLFVAFRWFLRLCGLAHCPAEK